MPQSRKDLASGPIRLVDVLRQLPERELESLIARIKIRVDEAKPGELFTVIGSFVGAAFAPDK